MIIFNKYRIKFRKLLRMLSIPKGHLVLDVGSGDGPFARANVLCDKFISETENRIGPILIDRPFIAADIMSLPFKTKSFNYIFCSHVLEHVDDPEKAMNELMRVGQKGYIETPSEFLEKIKSSPGHKWYVSLKNGVLIFRGKESDVFDQSIQEISEDKLINKDKTFMNFYWYNYYTHFNIAYEWSGKIDFEVIRSQNACLHDSELDSGDKKKSPDEGKEKFSIQKKEENTYRSEGFSRIKYLIKSLIKKIYAGNFDLFDLLACPICKGTLKLKEASLVCYNCNKGFYIRDGIPILIKNYSFDI